MKKLLGIFMLLLLQAGFIMLVWNVLIVIVCGQLIFQTTAIPFLTFWRSFFFGIILSFIYSFLKKD